MALIKCPECGKEVSDKAEICIHCGYPLARFKDMTEELKQNTNLKIVPIHNSVTYKIELIDLKDKKAKVQGILKKHCQMDAYKAFDIFKNLPQIVYSGSSKTNAVLIAQEFTNYGVQYKVYENSQEVDFNLKPQIEKTKEIRKSGYWSNVETLGFEMTDENNVRVLTSEINCPQCGKLISETERNCPYCGFNGIASYLLHKSSNNNFSQKSRLEVENQVKCPKCGSTQIQMIPRKWSLLTGFLTNKVDRVCVNCKHKF